MYTSLFPLPRTKFSFHFFFRIETVWTIVRSHSRKVALVRQLEIRDDKKKKQQSKTIRMFSCKNNNFGE